MRLSGLQIILLIRSFALSETFLNSGTRGRDSNHTVKRVDALFHRFQDLRVGVSVKGRNAGE